MPVCTFPRKFQQLCPVRINQRSIFNLILRNLIDVTEVRYIVFKKKLIQYAEPTLTPPMTFLSSRGGKPQVENQKNRMQSFVNEPLSVNNWAFTNPCGNIFYTIICLTKWWNTPSPITCEQLSLSRMGIPNHDTILRYQWPCLHVECSKQLFLEHSIFQSFVAPVPSYLKRVLLPSNSQ